MADRANEIRRLRAEGMTLRAICERVGCAKVVVNRALYQAVRDYERAYNAQRYRAKAVCELCGAPCTHNVHSQKSVGRWCQSCYRARRKEIIRRG